MNAIQSTTLMNASHEWATRPSDQRFTSLPDMLDHFRDIRVRSEDRVVTTRRIRAVPVNDDHRGLALEALVGRQETQVSLPTHWSFGQLAERAKAPASYLRRLPSELAADCLNHGFYVNDVNEAKLLVRQEPTGPAATLAAATGPNYGRIWNDDIVSALIDRFGDGVTGNFRVPGEFGNAVEVNKSNTTLYASDRDMFVFLADETNRIEIPDRRNGQSGSLARGFFVWNSDVGSKTFGIATFLFDFVCKNRIVWGATEHKEIRLRHTSGAPDRFLEEVTPALVSYANSSTASITEALETARAARVDDIDDFLSKRFTNGQAKGIKLAFEADELRPMETVWDVVTGVTAYARGIEHQDARVEMERIGGSFLSKGK
jgi:hypothetical protein